MIMATKSIEEIVQSRLGDYLLQTVRWTESGHDIILSLIPPFQYGAGPISLKFSWVTQLILDLEFDNLMGMPMLFEAEFKQISNAEWEVNLDFAGAPHGSIRFNCIAIELITEPSN
jgi:hypothetical protein